MIVDFEMKDKQEIANVCAAEHEHSFPEIRIFFAIIISKNSNAAH